MTITVSDPLHLRVAGQLGREIRAGAFESSGRLPSERMLAARFGVSRTTLRQALAELARLGLVRRRVGRGGGTFVQERIVERRPASLSGLSDELRRQGMAAGARVLRIRVRPADTSIANALELDPGDPIVEVVRLRFADGRPLAIEESSFPADRFPDLQGQTLRGSIYDLLRDRYATSVRSVVERLEAVPAPAADAVLLEVRRGSPMLAVERVAFDVGGVAFEFARDRFRGDRTQIVISATEGAA